MVINLCLIFTHAGSNYHGITLVCLSLQAASTTNSERALNTSEMCEMADFTWGESVVKLFIYYKLLFIRMANALRTNTTIMFFA